MIILCSALLSCRPGFWPVDDVTMATEALAQQQIVNSTTLAGPISLLAHTLAITFPGLSSSSLASCIAGCLKAIKPLILLLHIVAI